MEVEASALCNIQGSENTARTSSGRPCCDSAAALAAAKRLSATIRIAINANRKTASAVWALPYRAGTAYQPANNRDRHAEENNRGGVIRDGVVDWTSSSRQAGHHEILRYADDQHSKRPHGQKNESGKDQNMQSSCNAVAGMLPLPQPKLQHLSQSY
jgi:hypothetical protein